MIENDGRAISRLSATEFGVGFTAAGELASKVGGAAVEDALQTVAYFGAAGADAIATAPQQPFGALWDPRASLVVLSANRCN